jgi:hypothetical protein
MKKSTNWNRFNGLRTIIQQGAYQASTSVTMLGKILTLLFSSLLNW